MFVYTYLLLMASMLTLSMAQQQNLSISPAMTQQQKLSKSPETAQQQNVSMSLAMAQKQNQPISPAMTQQQNLSLSPAMAQQQNLTMSLAMAQKQNQPISPAMAQQQNQPKSLAMAQQNQPISPAMTQQQNLSLSPAMAQQQNLTMSLAMDQQKNQSISLAMPQKQNQSMPLAKPKKSKLPKKRRSGWSWAMAFYDTIYVPKRSDSIFISPISLKATLAVAALAAKGKTRQEILKSIDSNEGNLNNDILLPGKFKNLAQDRKMYTRKNMIDKRFRKKLNPAYSFHDVVFGSASTKKTINKSVKKVTKDKIGDIFPKGLKKNTALATSNVLYLSSEWKKEFTSTMKRGFKKPMVHQYGNFMFANLSDLNAAALLMELKDNDAKLLVLQPHDNDLQRLGDELLNEDLTELPNRLSSVHMSLFFPIIKEIKMSLSLKEVLVTMGLDRSITSKANFGNVLDGCEEDGGLKLGEVRQHTSFNSDRQKVNFVAVTGMEMEITSPMRSQFSLSSSPFSSSCTCLPDEYNTEFADPSEISERVLLSMRERDAPHYYFEKKLFFALIHKEDILFVGTLAREK